MVAAKEKGEKKGGGGEEEEEEEERKAPLNTQGVGQTSARLKKKLQKKFGTTTKRISSAPTTQQPKVACEM